MIEELQVKWKINSFYSDRDGHIYVTYERDESDEHSLTSVTIKKDAPRGFRHSPEMEFIILIHFTNDETGEKNKVEHPLVQLLNVHPALINKPPLILGRHHVEFQFINNSTDQIKEVVDLIHQHLGFDDDILEDVYRNFGLAGKLTYYEEITSLVRHDQHEQAIALANKLLMLRGKIKNHNPFELYETIMDIMKEFPETAVRLFLLMPQFLEVNLQLGEAYKRLYHLKVEKGAEAHEASVDLLQAIECFERIINNRTSQILLGIYPRKMTPMPHEYYKIVDQACDESMAEVLDQLLDLCKTDKIELDDITKISYQERQFYLRIKTSDLPNNQKRLDQLYDVLCGNDGLNPHVQNIEGSPEVLLALAREMRGLRSQLNIGNDLQGDSTRAGFFKRRRKVRQPDDAFSSSIASPKK